MSSRTLKEKQTERSRKRRERETRDAIAKLKARPDSAVVNGFPVSPVLHQIVRDSDGVFWKRNQTHTDWELLGEVTLFNEQNFEEFLTNSYLPVPIVSSLPQIPDDPLFARLVWFEGQLWGSAVGESRWYPAMRFTTNSGLP